MPLLLHHIKYTIAFTAITSILVLSGPVSASTVQYSSCEIRGDPDVYGIGLRWSFYLQWAALVIFLIASPQQADIARIASTITTFAVYINTFRNIHNGSLVAVEWPILWYLTSSLSVCNWPASKKGFQKNGGSLAAVLSIYAMYYLAWPWIFFKGLDVGREPGCSVKYFIFRPINVYSRGFRIAMKVFSSTGALTGAASLVGAIYVGSLWISGWGDESVERFYQRPNSFSASLGIFQLVIGAFTITFTEMTLKVNHVTFPNTTIADSGQLIALLIGIFALVMSLFSALKSLIKRAGEEGSGCWKGYWDRICHLLCCTLFGIL